LTLESEASGITGSISQLDERYINASGDTMTGDLTLGNSAISGDNDTQVKMDPNGTLGRHNYAPIIGGTITLNTTDYLYTIINGNIKPTSNPICTIVSPISASTIYGISVYGVSTGTFNVELSDIPAISGYYLNWLSFEYNL